MKPTDEMRAVNRQKALTRVLYCKSMLYLHDFITESEYSIISKRIEKWKKEYETSK